MDHILPKDQPLSVADAQRFYLRSLPLPSLPCTSLYINPLRTSDNSATKIAAATMELVRDENKGLKTLWYCETMWTRLHAYVSLVVSAEHKNDPAIKEGPLFHVSECPNAPEFPPSSYEDGYRQMHAIEALQSFQPHPVVCNIEGIQDAVNSQILDLINAALQMRYENKADKLSPGTTYINSENEAAIASDVKASCFYPAWLRSCYKNHINKHMSTAGFTDRMLFVSPACLNRTYPKRTQVALQEGKPSWVYSTADYQDILRGSDSIINGRAFYVSENAHKGNLLLKQLWGEIADLGPDAGFTTNGDVVMVFFRVLPRDQNPDDSRGSRSRTSQSTTPYVDSGFVLSPLMKWNDMRLRACLLALSFMTLDEESWMSRNGNPVSLRDLLCPVSECRQILQAEAQILAH